MWNVSAASGDTYHNHCAKETPGEILTKEWATIINMASFLIGPPRCIPGSRVRLCHFSCGSLRRWVGHPSFDSRCSGGRLPPQTVVPDSDPDDGLLPACGRGSASHTARVRLASGRPAVPQPRGRLSPRQLDVSLHAGGHLHSAQSDASTPQL
jgi:hypothetical protein